MRGHDTTVPWPEHLGRIMFSDGALTAPCQGASRASRGPWATLACTPDRQILHLEGRLTHTHRDALAILATRPNPIIQLQIVADHGDTGQHVRSVADERGALQGRADAAVLDGIGLAGGEDELARGDVDLAAAEVDGVDAARHRTDDLLRIVRA